MEIHGGDQARSFQEILKLPRPFLSQAEQMELGMSSLCPTPAFRLSLLATCNDANPLVCCPLDTTTTAGSILHLRLGRTQQKHPKQTASNHPTGMETQRHRRRRRTSRNGLVLGALCFIATLPFLYLQKDKYEQRRLLAATSYSQHVDHPILKGFHRRRRNRGMKEDNSSGRKGNDDAHRSLHNITQSQAPPQDEHDCLVVFHLPKTGGSSLLYALRFFALERGWEFYDYHGEQREVWQEPTKPVHRAIHYGHFYSTFLERSGTSQCLRMTLLRDPIGKS